MNFYLIGIDHNSAGLDNREAAHNRLRALRFRGAEALTTCNRVEIYGVCDTAIEARSRLERFRKNFKEFANGYFLSGEKAVFSHALKVACGLESQLKAESQILQQLDMWRGRENFNFFLGILMDDVIAEARRIRREALLDDVNVNISDIILDDISHHSDIPPSPSIIIIGTGKIAELFAKRIDMRATLVFVANKNFKKAQELASLCDGKVLSFKELPDALSKADIAISATKSPHFILKNSDVAEPVLRRKRRLYIYDAASPRDIDPAIAELDGVALRNMDDLGEIFEKYNGKIRASILSAETLIEEAVKRYGVDIDEPDFEDRDAAERLGLETGRRDCAGAAVGQI